MESNKSTFPQGNPHVQVKEFRKLLDFLSKRISSNKDLAEYILEKVCEIKNLKQPRDEAKQSEDLSDCLLDQFQKQSNDINENNKILEETLRILNELI